MSDKDLTVLVAELLRKQDQHSEILKKHSKNFEKIETTLSTLVEISINQFEQQQVFNEKFLEKIDNIGKLVDKTLEIDGRVSKLESTINKK